MWHMLAAIQDLLQFGFIIALGAIFLFSYLIQTLKERREEEERRRRREEMRRRTGQMTTGDGPPPLKTESKVEELGSFFESMKTPERRAPAPVERPVAAKKPPELPLKSKKNVRVENQKGKPGKRVESIERRHLHSNIDGRHTGHIHSTIENAHLKSNLTDDEHKDSPKDAGSGADVGPLIDLRRLFSSDSIAGTLIVNEIFGPPKSLRQDG